MSVGKCAKYTLKRDWGVLLWKEQLREKRLITDVAVISRGEDFFGREEISLWKSPGVTGLNVLITGTAC